MAGRGMGCAVKGGGAVASGPKNHIVSSTSTKTGPVMMKKGGMVKRYSEGGDVNDDYEDNDGEVMRRSYASGVRVKYEDDAPKSSKRAAGSSRSSDAVPSVTKATAASSEDDMPRSRPAATDRASDLGALSGSYRRSRRGAAEKAAENEFIRENITAPLMTAIPAGRVAKGAMDVGRMAKRAREMGYRAKELRAQEITPTAKEMARAERIRDRGEMEAMRQGKSFGDRDIGYKRGGMVKKYKAGGYATKVKRYRKGGMCA